MTKTKKRKNAKKRKQLRKLFNESGVKFYEPSTGIFKVNGVTYYPKAKKYQKKVVKSIEIKTEIYLMQMQKSIITIT